MYYQKDLKNYFLYFYLCWFDRENTPSVRVTVDVNVREARQVIFPHFCNVVWRPVLTIFEIHNG